MPRASDYYRLEPHYACIAAGIALMILYGSFFPFGFYAHHDPRGPLGVLLDSGFHTSRDDVVANIFLYVPFGFFAAFALEKRILAAVAGAAIAGFLLSLFVELGQFYDAGRYQELSDVCCNTSGALLGASAAVAVRRRVSSVYVALLLACWLGSRCYPASAAMQPPVAAVDLFRYFAAWLAAGVMMETLCGASRSRVALPLFLAGSLLVRSLTAYTEPAEIAGGAAAVLIWTGLLWGWPARAKIAAILLMASVILLALAPFHFSAIPRSFGWMPFRSFLGAPTETAIRVFFEKAFLYGGMIWLMVRAGLSLGAATAVGAILVFALRYLQVYLPARSAEITDAALLLMLAALMKLSSMAETGKLSKSG